MDAFLPAYPILRHTLFQFLDKYLLRDGESLHNRELEGISHKSNIQRGCFPHREEFSYSRMSLHSIWLPGRVLSHHDRQETSE